MNIIIVAGARPNFMKIAPIIEALRPFAPVHRSFLVHTGQHYDKKMSAEIFSELGLPEPDINLGIGGGSHAEQTAHVMIQFEKVCLSQYPDWVVVVGDVNSTLACALTAKKLGIKVAHVEAGLRSRDLSMPEEINRLCTDVISDLLFTTDEEAGANLQAEGTPIERIRFVGNTMIDTLLRNLEHARAVSPIKRGDLSEYAVLTMHRPSNVDNSVQLTRLFSGISRVAERIPIVFPAHPRTLKRLEQFGLLGGLSANPRYRIVEAMSYLPFIGLITQAKLVLTDSGGLQEETTVLGVPCVTMRPNTERPITCTSGTNILAGTDPDTIAEVALKVLDGHIRAWSIPNKWDGKAAARIVAELIAQI